MAIGIGASIEADFTALETQIITMSKCDFEYYSKYMIEHIKRELTELEWKEFSLKLKSTINKKINHKPEDKLFELEYEPLRYAEMSTFEEEIEKLNLNY